MNEGDTAVAYLRVSVVGDRARRGRLESPEMQREVIDAWCTTRGITVVEEIRDLNRSGGTLTRPGLDQAIGLVRDGRANGIIVARSDRASRRTIDGLGLIDTLEQLGGWIAAVDGTIDTTDRVARMATTMMFAVGQHELDRYREQSAVVHERAIIEKGRHMGPAPYGYTRDQDGRLTIQPEEAAVVRWIFEQRADGGQWTTMARQLERRGVGRAGGRLLTATSIRRLVTRRVYLGEASHGQHVRRDAHPAIVSAALFAAANRAAPVVRAATQAHRAHPESLLRGMLRCAGCRYVMKRLPQRNGTSRWVCRTVATERTVGHHCSAPARLTGMEGEEVERWVIEQFKRLATGASIDRADDSDTPRLERQLADEEAILDELSSLDTRRELGQDRWIRLVREAREAVEATRRQLATVRARENTHGSMDRQQLDAWWQTASLEARQAALRSIVQATMIVAGAAPAAERSHIIPAWEPISLPYVGNRDIPVEPWEPR